MGKGKRKGERDREKKADNLEKRRVDVGGGIAPCQRLGGEPRGKGAAAQGLYCPDL